MVSPSGMSCRRWSLRLVAALAEDLERLVPRHLDALERRVLGDDLAHLRLDRREVLGREGAGEAEVVLELLAVVLAAGVVERLRPEPGHRVGQHVLGRVADELARLGAAGGEELERAAGARAARADRSGAPASSAPTASWASRGPMEWATSRAVVPADTARSEPSGRVRTMVMESCFGGRLRCVGGPARTW